MKKSQNFILKYEWLKLMEILTDAEFRQLLLAMVSFRIDGVAPSMLEGDAQRIADIIFPRLNVARKNEVNGKRGGNPSLKKKITASKPTATRELFERFWQAYPRKVGKAYAEACFARQKPTEELLKTMLASIEEQAKSEQWKQNKGKFIPNPATWINQQRWLDSIEVQAPRNKFLVGTFI